MINCPFFWNEFPVRVERALWWHAYRVFFPSLEHFNW
jgi:hypothetical protein